MTLKKDKKGAGGCTSFSMNMNAVKDEKYAELTEYRYDPVPHISNQSQKYTHLDLNPSRIRKDENAVQKILSTIDTT